MDVSIVIRTKNEQEFIGATLRKVKQQEFSGSYEIIVVDSGSTDSTLEIVSDYDLKLLEIPQKDFSYGRALNMGASAASGRFVVNLSAHALPTNEKWLTNLLAGLYQKDVAAAYGRQSSRGHLNPFEARLNELFFGSKKLKFNLKSGRILKANHFTNSNASFKKDVWHKLKFDERIPWGEDVVWQKEVIRAGFSIVYTPDAAVYHTHKINLPSVYSNSKNCAYNLLFADKKKQSVPLIVADVALFLSLIPGSMLQNLAYVLRGSYYRHAAAIPFWVFSELLGSLVGRISYRLNRQLW